MYLFSPFCIVSNIKYSINAIQCLMISWTIFFSKYKRERYYINNLFINKGKTNTLNVLNFSTCITLTFKLYSHTILPTVVQYYHNIEIILLKCNRKNLCICKQTAIPCVLYHTHGPESYSVKQNDRDFNLLQRSLK